MPVTETLTEMLFVAHFAAPVNMTVLDAADWCKEFKEFPVLQQTPPAQPLDLSQYGQNTVNIISAPASLRLVIRSTKDPFVLQIQDDRFGYSWTRNKDFGAEVEYPGYELIKKSFMDNLSRMNSWHRLRFAVPATFRLLEIAYYNALPLEKSSGEKRRLSEVFKVGTPGRPVNAFAANWMEMLHLDPDAPRVVAQIGVSAFQGQPSPTSSPIAFFNFAGAGPLAGVASDDPAIGHMADSLHDRILSMYHATITSPAP